MKITADAQKDLRYLSFNQQNGFFAAGTGTGFHIFSCEPFKQKCEKGAALATALSRVAASRRE